MVPFHPSPHPHQEQDPLGPKEPGWITESIAFLGQTWATCSKSFLCLRGELLVFRYLWVKLGGEGQSRTWWARWVGELGKMQLIITASVFVSQSPLGPVKRQPNPPPGQITRSVLCLCSYSIWFSYLVCMCLVIQSCLTLCNPNSRLLSPWDSPGKNTGVRCHALLQGIFPTQGLNPGLLHCRQIL